MPEDLDALGDKINAARQAGAEPAPDPQLESRRQGLQAGAELVTAIIAGVLLGLALDHWLGTSPGFLLGGLALGFATALYNIYRITQGCGTGVGFCALRGGEKAGKTGADSQD